MTDSHSRPAYPWQRPPQSLERQALERAAGQMVMVGFDGAGRTAPDHLLEAIARQTISGVILFARNIQSASQVRALNERLQSASPDDAPPLLIGVDQEGGRVMRVRDDFPSIPPMADVWREGGVDAVREVSDTIATELAELGFNLNFAPVLDVRTNPDNEVIGDRAFSDASDDVCRAATAYIHAHHDAGMLTCGKHFPGHGDTLLDSHEDLPTIDHPAERLRQIEFPPFSAAIEAGVPAVMTAHVLLTSVDADRPATLSPTVLSYLRDELNFDGAVVSDDIEMHALADRYSPSEIAKLGLAAGLDLFLVCHTWNKSVRLRDTLTDAAVTDEQDAERVIQSAHRVHRCRRRAGAGSPSKA